MDYIYKRTRACKTCLYLTHRKSLRDSLTAELRTMGGYLTYADAIKKYGLPLTYQTISQHFKLHVKKVEKRLPVRTYSDKTPIKDVVGVVSDASLKDHEQTLDEFISQFHDAVKEKSLKMTVKDGLAAIKIKADIENRNKDRKTDLLKQMIGASGEHTRPAE